MTKLAFGEGDDEPYYRKIGIEENVFMERVFNSKVTDPDFFWDADKLLQDITNRIQVKE